MKILYIQMVFFFNIVIYYLFIHFIEVIFFILVFVKYYPIVKYLYRNLIYEHIFQLNNVDTRSSLLYLSRVFIEHIYVVNLPMQRAVISKCIFTTYLYSVFFSTIKYIYNF